MRAAAVKYELLPTPASSGAAQRRRYPRSILVIAGVCVSVLLLAAVYWSSDSFRSSSTAPVEKAEAISTPSVTRFDVSAYEIDNVESVDVALVYANGSSDIGNWIGVYCLASDDDVLAIDDYIDRRDASERAGDRLTFGPLVNLRCSLQFKLIGADGRVLATAPKLVRFRKGPMQPTQVHLAMTEKADEMRVSWVSAPVASRARVRFGKSASSLDQEVVAAWTTYDADDLCGPPANVRGPRQFRDPGRMYTGVMAGLQHGTKYHYQVGSGDVWSDVHEFQLPPAKGVDTVSKPLSLFVFGDLMTATSATRDFRIQGSCGTTMELIEKDLASQPERDYAALFHVGDLSYAAGKGYVWDHFGTLIERVAARIPYMVSIGNHDFGFLEGRERNPLRAPRHAVFEADGTHGHDAYGECGVPSEQRFRMPMNGNGIYWYSVDIGLSHHTVLSGEHDFSIGSPMREWLERDLASVDRAKTPWLLVHLHRPLYCSVAFGGDFTRSLYLRDHLEALFAQYRVDVVFSGHYHSYERTCPVYDDACHYGANGEARAPVHIMVGSGGANVDTFGYYSVAWSEYARMEYGYGRLHVFNATHAQFEFVSNRERRVTDEMWIVSSHDWTLHTQWRWRRVVLHPSLVVVIFVAVAAVTGVAVRLWTRGHPKKRH